ncbi:MAG: DUF4124 domain-containing protein [Acinetobacter guillouiae]
MKQRQRFAHTVFVSTIFALFSVVGVSTSYAKQYYKWVDSKGSTHYTTTPPPKNARSQSKVNTYGYHGDSRPTNPAPTAQPNASQNQPQNGQPQGTQPVTPAPVVNPPNAQQPNVAPQNEQNTPPSLATPQ